MITMDSIRFYLFLLALALYAVLGTPTPDYPGVIEGAIGALLVLAVGLPQASYAILPQKDAPLWHGAGKILLLYGLSVAVLGGALRSFAPGEIMRDILPFLFMMLPILAADLFSRNPRYAQILPFALAALGLAQAARVCLQAYGADFLPLFVLDSMREPHYLANSPAVMFAALALCGAGIWAFVLFSVRRAGLAIALFLLAALPLAAMALALQRAGLGIWALYVLALCAAAFVKRPAKAGLLVLILGGAGLMLAFGSPLGRELIALLEALWRKTELFGSNMRLQDAAAVWGAVSEGGWPALLLGLGWGAGFESPAVGGMYVGYTHGLIGAVFLKTGVIGLVLGGVYIGGLLMDVHKRISSPVRIVFWAAALPVLVDVFLYASYKSLDFGLVLLLISGLEMTRVILPAQRPCSMDKVSADQGIK